MNTLRAEFEAYGGDYDATMSRFLGKEDRYLRFLNMLPKDDNFDKLGAALARGDLDAAFEAAHTLKGVAGNLGLEPLYQALNALVEPLRAREDRDYGALYGAVAEGFRAAEQLRRRLAEEELA